TPPARNTRIGLPSNLDTHLPTLTLAKTDGLFAVARITALTKADRSRVSAYSGGASQVAMTELAEAFNDFGLTQYLHSFLEQGFDTWDTILDITEPDFDVLGVKLGHRRKLQKIAATRGVNHGHQALTSPKRSTSVMDDKLLEEGKGVATLRSDGKDGSSSIQLRGKRKYRRHPKPNQDAPTRPRSAYVIFSNKMREDLKGRSLSFIKIAKLAGRSWQNLTASEKEPYEQQAFDAKEKCAIEFAEYRQTESYKAYSEYLLSFDAELQESSRQEPNGTFKEPNLDNIPSASSTSTEERTTASSLSHEVPYTRTVSILDTNLATYAEAQISPNSAVQESIEDKSRSGEGWTEVTEDVLLIRHLIDLYFSWEHPITSSLMKEPFLKDFSQGRRRHCSSLLINAMSALACRFSDRPEVRADPNKGDTIGDHFFMEAKRLLQANMHSCLTTIQALGLMSIREASCGRESNGYFYSCQSIRMAIELGLHQNFDESRLVFSSVESEVRSVTFWAAFVMDSTWSLLVGRVPQISRRAVSAAKPASIQREEEEDWVPYTDAGIQAVRTYKQRSNIVSVFRSLCEISEIISDTLYLLYAPGGHLTSRKILGVYELYLNWYDALLVELRFAQNFTPAGLYIQFLGSTSSPLDICAQSAENISSLLQSYRQLYSLRRASSFIPYLVLISSVNNLIHGRSQIVLGYTVQNFGDLTDMSFHHGFAFRSLDILRYFARHWNIFPPSSSGIAGAPPNATELCPPSNSSLNFFCPRLTSALRTVADTILFYESKQQTHLFLPFPHQGAPLLFDEAFTSGADSDQSEESQLRLDGFEIIDQQAMKAPCYGAF
ncbi:hypothetical protein V500_03990, partial [Pseudogymnoascus sp. VKM F-4518 (FW-2643)]